jgi:hypothetical protein
VEIHTQTRLLRFEHGEALVRNETTGEQWTLGPFDSVLVAVGHRSHDPLSAALREAGLEVEVVGDAQAPGQVWDATQTGHNAISALLSAHETGG